MKKLLPLLLALLLALGGCAAVGRVELPDNEDSGTSDQPAPPEDNNGDTLPPEETLSPEQKKAKAIFDGMTVEQKVGQLFLARCPKASAPEEAAKYALGGYILFGRDFEAKTRDQAAADIAACQQSAAVPMLIAVDEEGGTVNRISRYSQFRSIPFRSPSQLYAEGGFDLIQTDTAEKCRLLSSLGINVNMAPVCDITTDPNGFMYKRSFGVSAEMTSRYVLNVVSVMKAEKMGSVLKHFPGYGDCGDSHTGVTRDTRPLETFYSSDLLPFKEGINAGCGAVLVCHNIVEAMDDQNPASLSPEVHRVLREELGFDGVAVTDDLYMDAIRDQYGVGEAAVLAVLAGNDLLCCTEYDQQVPAVIEAVGQGRITEDRINESVMRVLMWKISLGIIE